MDCGVPFCHQGCPLGNLIPEWNDLVRRGDGRQARLNACTRPTTSQSSPDGYVPHRVSRPASWVSTNHPVTIKQIEVSIIDKAWAEGWVHPVTPERLTGKTVAVIGSGPAGLAAAQQLTRVGHTVAVFERDDRIGGLLRYGIPDFKMEKKHLDQRLAQMQAEGTRFRAGVEVGVDISAGTTSGSVMTLSLSRPVPAFRRDIDIPGRESFGRSPRYGVLHSVQQGAGR
jgi:glutamate synthase (NADPH/NADH) small chain